MNDKLPKSINTGSPIIVKSTEDMFGKGDHTIPLFIGFLGFVLLIVLFVGLESSPEMVGEIIASIFSDLISIWPLSLTGIAVFLMGYVSYCKYLNSAKKIKIIDVSDVGVLIGRMNKTDEIRARSETSNPVRDASFRPDTKFQLGSGRLNRSFRNKTKWVEWKNLDIVFLDSSKGDNYKNVHLKTNKGIVYVIERENAFWWIKEESFFSYARANASNFTIDIPEKKVYDKEKNIQYTNLWLENFSKPEKRIKYGDLSEGSELNSGQYRVVSKLGAGGQGCAYLAKQVFDQNKLSTGQNVVLKEYILPNNRGAEVSEDKSNSLLHEAEILSKIDNEQIVSLLDCFVEDHRGYLVLEYISGDSLRDLVKNGGKQLEANVIDWSIQICDILNYLHNLYPPIIHRDLTPDNLILEKSGKVKLFDFTVARQFESSRSATVVGKQSYIPPEQFCGKASPASDIYALGCSMFYLLVGVDPEPMEESRPKENNAEISDALSSIVSKATQLDLANRYPSALHMKADLFKLQDR